MHCPQNDKMFLQSIFYLLLNIPLFVIIIYMKTVLNIIIFFFLGFGICCGQDNLAALYHSFYENYVSNGLVDYKKIQHNEETFRDLVQELNLNHSSFDKKDVASLINIYNIKAIEFVVDAYPVTSVKEIPGFFDHLTFSIGQEAYTLDKLEKRIKKLSSDGRYHFALICASRSCPPFPKEAFTSSSLNEQLNAQCKLAFNAKNYIRISQDLMFLPPIFSWYKKELNKGNQDIKKLLSNHYNQALPEEYSIRFYPYDWSLNDVTEHLYSPKKQNPNYQSYTPSVLIQEGSFELKMFNNIYTQTNFFNQQGEKEAQSRSTFYTGIIDFLYGSSKNLNIGFNVFLRGSRFDSPSSSFTDILKFENNAQARFTISHIGPSIKISPFKNKKYSIKSILLIPIASDLDGSREGQPFLDNHAFQMWNQLFYDTKISEKFRLFTEVTTILKLDTNFDFNKSAALIPMKAFISYFPNTFLSVYTFADFTPSIATSIPYYLQTGIGSKIVLFNKFEIELMYSEFIAGKLNGAGKTYNLGLRYIY